MWVSLVLALGAFALPWFVTFEGLSPEGHRVFGIFLLAIVLWVSEAVPLHATAALIILLEILFVSDAAVLPLPDDSAVVDYREYYYALANPVLMLFLGGFFLANGAAKYNLDRNLARVLLRPFGTSPRMILLGLMLITALFSMFMSNTATTATLMAVVLPVVAGLDRSDRMRTGLALSIPIAANIGGIGTPVGTPPNAIALGAMNQAGISLSFLQWMAMTIPCMLLTLLFAWVLLNRMFPCSRDRMEINIDSTFDTSRDAWIFYTVFVATILLWLTEPLHGVRSSIVGFVPVTVLLCTRVFSAQDLQQIQWHVLWLVGGGIALGTGVSSSGLDTWLIGLIRWETLGAGVLTTVMCLVALVMGCVISHSATANLLVPIGMSLATSGAVALSPMMAGVYIAIGASLAMALPISTPPNAIAYSTGMVQTRDMAKSGIVIGLTGLLLFVLLAPRLWNLFGLATP